MLKPDLEQLESLMTNLVFPFYKIDRDAVAPIEPRKYENDAEHSWSLAFLACSLAPEIDGHLNMGKVAQIAIVHDLVEVFAGDTSLWGDVSMQESKRGREEQALKRISKDFASFPWIAQTIKEYEDRSSNEAKYIYAVDKVIVLLFRYLDHGKYYVDEHITKEHFDERIVSHRKKAHEHPAIGEYCDQILGLFDSHPEYFYRE